MSKKQRSCFENKKAMISSTRILSKLYTVSALSLLIALFSFILSVYSINSTIKSQELDAEYKEISIMPALRTAGSDSEMYWKVENVGLGPSTINRVHIVSNGECFDSDQYPMIEAQAKYRYLVSLAVNELFKNALHKNDLDLNSLIKYFETNSMIGQTLKPSESVPIFKSSLGGRSIVEEADKLSPGWGFELSQKLVQFQENLEFNLAYCSISQKKCYTPQRSANGL